VTITIPVNISDPNATCLNTVKMVASTRPQMITQLRVLQVLVGEGFRAKVTTQTLVQGASLEAEEAKNKLQILEERLSAIEGRFREAIDLCLVPDVTIPHKFKVSKFEKYKGTSCPKSHLTMYCRKMAAYACDEKLLVHFFQDSLAATTLNWYMHLEPARICSWRDLEDAFLKQYKYNVDLAPDRLQLQNMSKKGFETFKEYAQGLRELAAPVKPPLHDTKMMAMFINTLQSPFYEHMLGSVSSSFVVIIVIGDIIEFGLKSGKIAHGPLAATNTKKPGFDYENKEGEVQATTTLRSHVSPHYKQKYPLLTKQPSYVANIMSVYHTHRQGFHQPPLVQNNSNQGQGQGHSMTP